MNARSFSLSRVGDPDSLAGAPAFILGAPRSGTSLLYKLLCMHPDAAWISNWNRRLPGVLQLSALDRVPRRLPARRRAVWFGPDSNAYVYGRTRSLADRLFPMPVEGEPLFVRCGLPLELDSTEDVSPAAVAALQHSFRGIRRYGGGKIVVSKRIGNNYRIPALVAAFPDARFVHLVRDGRAVASSLQKVDWWADSIVHWYGGTPKAWEAGGGDPWEIAAREWVEEVQAVERGIESLESGQVLTIHYERLLTDPLGSLNLIADFVGLDRTDQWQDEVDQLGIATRRGEERACLAPEIQSRVEQWQRPTLERYGYAV